MAEATLNTKEVDDWMANALAELPRAASNRIRRKATDAASRFFESRLQALTPTFDTGALKRSMTRVVRSYTRRGRRGSTGSSKQFLGVVGPSLITGPHAHLVEFGTDERYTTGRGRAFRLRRDTGGVIRTEGLYRGSMPAMPFFENIFAVSVDGGREVIESTVRAELTREFERIARVQRAIGGE